MIYSLKIPEGTLGVPEDGTGDWSPVRTNLKIFEPPKLPQSVSAMISLYKLPEVVESKVANALGAIAALELVASPLVGLVCGYENAELGWCLFFSGIISGLILLGFARVIENTSESAQRLTRIEMLIARGRDEKNTP
jgi:hypothetical protein